MSQLSKKIFGAVLIVVAVGLPWRTTAGEIKVSSGSLAFLKQERQVNLEYDDTGMKVGRKAKDSVPMDEFIARENQNLAGRGDSWKLQWAGERIMQYQPRFQELLNKQFSEDNIPLEFGAFKDAKYTLILKTKIMMTGKPWPPFPYPPKITADAVVVETNDRNNPVAVVNIVNVPGQNVWGSPDMSEAYAKAGKDLGIMIRDKIQ
jgi:hypothetical protein